ncbi:hypothetical protein [Rummeliibacillus pycnus]|uniref:hypothetical protein n=1 Tax=Rummeliibacillus pycnus TaxID=101070 RepID=UPI000C9C58B4|nr:hypothetical protein [Rummeliibacillus pycnus]
MSDFLQAVSEINKIDELLLQQYQMKKITENLEGALIEFKKFNHPEIQELHIGTADARKYASVKVFEQVYKTFI